MIENLRLGTLLSLQRARIRVLRIPLVRRQYIFGRSFLGFVDPFFRKPKNLTEIHFLGFNVCIQLHGAA